MKLTTEELLMLLDELKSRIQTGDSFEGALTYTFLDDELQPGEWEVSGTYGVGKDGRIMHWSKEMISNNDLLARYRFTRDGLLDALGHDSTLDKSSRMAAVRVHLDILDLIKARFPECQHAHSTAEWYLTPASVPDQTPQPPPDSPGDLLARLRAKNKR